MDICEEIMQQSQIKLKNFIKLKDKPNIKKFETICKILKHDNALLKLDTEIAINILTDVYEDEKTAKKIYLKLLQK